jgi:citrate lyase beta subunit
MAATAAIYKDVFLKHGLPSTFLTDFESVIAKLEESVSDRQQDVVRRISARLQLELAATHGRVVLRVLDALVRRAAADNESLLRGWEAARLIRRSSVRESTSIVA